MSGIYRQLAALSPARRALLERRLAERGLAAGRPAIPRRPEGASAPLSFAQQRLWFVQQLDPGAVAYNMMTALRLQGPLDAGALRRAMTGLIARHEALRARVETGPDGAPRQVVGKTPADPFANVDLAAAPDPLAAARARVSALAAAPYDLTRPPLRAELMRLGPEDHVLALGLHHIAGDRWSMGVMVRDLAALYAGADLAPAGQMPDLAAWQRGAGEDRLAADLDHWRARLADAPALDLPLDRPRGEAPGRNGGFLPFALSPELAQAARTTARARGVSLFTVLLAAFNLFLSRWCDADDVLVGSEMANRDRPETQSLVGPLVNTLVLRTDLAGVTGFGDALARTAVTLREAFARAEAPFEQVVEAVNPPRRLNEMTPLFQVKFDLQQAEALPPALGRLRLERLAYDEEAAKYELRFNLVDAGEVLGGRVEYCADLFDADTIARMADQYIRLLAALLADPEAPAAQAALLSEGERDDLGALGRGPDLPPHAATLHAAFEAAVDRVPEAVALTHAGVDTTYAALEARANAVAEALIARGLAPETRVGVCMGRSPDMVAAILGALKAGCAYVPLDPAYPPARIAFVAGDAGADLVLTDVLTDALTDGRATPRRMTAIDVAALPAAAPRPAPRGAPEGLAVVIYTSGTTGQPKGVALEHRNILARVAWAETAHAPGDFAGTLFGTSISFDLSLFEIFATLALGGRLVLAETLLDLPRLPAEAGVTLINTVPSLLRELVSRHDLPRSVRAVNLAGEFFPPALLDRLREFPGIRLIHNLYGPTEDAIYDAGNPVQDEPERPMPIGRPFPGTRIRILDRNGALAPRGMAGEICVGGAGLARGYLNRPELTAARFLDDPFEPGARLYRTGDRGRWRRDGRIDILGRIDAQVKIRGVRIETGEIEAVLEAHGAVAEAVVLAEGEAGAPDRRLVAHLALRPGASVAPADLRSHLADRLPAHMTPARVHVLAEMPRMPNGKIDRKALARTAAPAGSARVPTPPATETEARICALWAETLAREAVGAEDDFFEIGGHSLLAMRLLLRLQEEFGRTLTIAQLFRALTPRAQAALVDATPAAAPAPIPAAPAAEIVASLSEAEVEALLARLTGETAE